MYLPLEEARIFLRNPTFLLADLVLLAGALIIFLVGLVLLYKKGSWLGIPISLSGILLVVIAIFAKLFSF
jgi:hypothetical protein